MLDKTSKRVLRLIISKYNNADELISILPSEAELSSSALNNLCDNLCKHKYLSNIFYSHNSDDPIEVFISHEGLHYFEINTRQNLRFWIPIIISIIALAKSFMPELLSLSEAILKLLKR